MLIDLYSSWQSVNQIPISTLGYLQNSNLIPKVSSPFRRTRRVPKRISSSGSSSPSLRSPKIRRPSDRYSSGNGSVCNSPNSASTSRSESATELELFLELLPLRMRRKLYRHKEIEQLIEVVMDLGRQSIARFPSGDWIISEEPIKHEDLLHAISKVIEFKRVLVYINDPLA